MATGPKGRRWIPPPINYGGAGVPEANDDLPPPPTPIPLKTTQQTAGKHSKVATAEAITTSTTATMTSVAMYGPMCPKNTENTTRGIIAAATMATVAVATAADVWINATTEATASKTQMISIVTEAMAAVKEVV